LLQRLINAVAERAQTTFGWFTHFQVVTVEDVHLFKTAPQAYELLLKAFPIKKEEILFVSSNAWDALAAKWYGFDVFWVNRLGHPFEEIGEKPNYEGTSLSKVLEVIN
jgi:2-haloacid dehalogenase